MDSQFIEAERQIEAEQLEQTVETDAPEHSKGCGCLTSLVAFALGIVLLRVLLYLVR